MMAQIRSVRFELLIRASCPSNSDASGAGALWMWNSRLCVFVLVLFSFCNHASAVTFSKVMNKHRPHSVPSTLRSSTPSIFLLYIPTGRETRFNSFHQIKKSVFLLLYTPGLSPAGGAPLCGRFVMAKLPARSIIQLLALAQHESPTSPHTVCVFTSCVSVTGVCSSVRAWFVSGRERESCRARDWASAPAAFQRPSIVSTGDLRSVLEWWTLKYEYIFKMSHHVHTPHFFLYPAQPTSHLVLL